jgi:hypothetical protein
MLRKTRAKPAGRMQCGLVKTWPICWRSISAAPKTAPSKKAAKASFLQHHWNDHQFCGSCWCQAKDRIEAEKEKFKNKFRDKEKNQKEYKQQLEIQKKFTETDRMKSVFHKFSTNKVEQIHSLLTEEILLLSDHLWEGKNIFGSEY